MNSLPTPKMERWKYSNLPAFVGGNYDEQPLSVGYSGDDAYVTSDEMEMTPWAQETYADMQLWDGSQDVLSIVIPKASDDIKIDLSMMIEQNTKSSGHINIVVEEGATLTLSESIDCAGWCNRSMSIQLQMGAKMVHLRDGKGDGVLTNLTQVQTGENADYRAYALNNFGEFMRDQIHVKMMGEGGACYLSGAKILNDKQHCDSTILIEHLIPNCHSNQNYRNLLDGQSRGVFQGKVHVHQIAQQTDGYQLCNSVLLSDRAEMNTKPELEIYADDVKCSHGAVTAQPDAEPLFYLMARGIPEKQAQTLLLQAFVSESLDAFIDNAEIYELLSYKLERALNA